MTALARKRTAPRYISFCKDALAHPVQAQFTTQILSGLERLQKAVEHDAAHLPWAIEQLGYAFEFASQNPEADTYLSTLIVAHSLTKPSLIQDACVDVDSTRALEVAMNKIFNKNGLPPDLSKRFSYSSQSLRCKLAADMSHQQAATQIFGCTL